MLLVRAAPSPAQGWEQHAKPMALRLMAETLLSLCKPEAEGCPRSALACGRTTQITPWKL